MNICFFLGGFHQNGGIGRVTAMLSNALAASQNFNIIALCYCDPKLPNIYDVSSKIEQRFFLQTYSSMTKQMATGGIKRLRKILNDNDIDILIACGALFYPISVLACKGIKTKCICWEHSDPEGNNDHRGQYWARRFGIKRSNLNVVLTKQALKVYEEKYRARNTVQIYNPVDKAVFKSAGNYNVQSHKIISVGRLTYQKNFQVAVQVAAKVLCQHPDWVWDIYGKGEDYDELLRLSRQEGISDQLRLMGQVDDLYERYKDYSLMVMTSRYEGFPMTLLEGSGNALPLISFDIPTGPSEIIEDGVNGFLINEGDVKTMADRILKLMRDENLRKEMSDNSLRESGKFSVRDITAKWERTLHKVVRS